MKLLIAIQFVLPIVTICAHAKEFVNLNFDSGAFPPGPTPDFLQPVDLMLPGWTARMGEHVLTEVLWNNVYAANGSVSVYSAGASVQGRYAVFLVGGAEYPSTGPLVSASISQVGAIPMGAQSLLFRAIGAGSPTEVRLDGASVPLVPVGGQGAQQNYGVNISAYGGREVELSFVNYIDPRTGSGGAFLDSLSFSSTFVPEPSTWILLGSGSLVLMYAARRRGGDLR